MVFVDEDNEVAEYRRIIDLEWLKKKPRGWVGARNSWKQWLVVTEPLKEKHQDILDEAAEAKETYESYPINAELYEMIVAAPRDLQPRIIQEATEVDGDSDTSSKSESTDHDD